MITAARSEKCSGCGSEIHAGEKIGMVDGDWVCEECVETMGEEEDDGFGEDCWSFFEDY